MYCLLEQGRLVKCFHCALGLFECLVLDQGVTLFNNLILARKSQSTRKEYIYEKCENYLEETGTTIQIQVEIFNLAKLGKFVKHLQIMLSLLMTRSSALILVQHMSI